MKMYRFIGNMEDVTPCGNMDEECIAVGCKGKVWGQCHFDPKLNLLSSGSECYEEVRDTVFRVEKDNLFSRLVRNLKQLENRALKCHYGTDCFLHISRVRELAENGFYHLEGKK